VHFGFLLSAALQCTPISEPALFRNDVQCRKDAPSQLSLLNNTLQRKDPLLNDNRVRRTAAHHCFHQSRRTIVRVPYC